MVARRPRSIRRLVLALFAASILVAMGLLATFESVVSSYYRGESTAFTRLFHSAQPTARSARTMVHVMRAFNAALLEGPDSIAQVSFLRALARRAAPLAIALRIENRIEFTSLVSSAVSPEKLPAFGAPGPEEPFGEEDEPAIRVVYQFDFRMNDGSASSFFLLRPPGSESRQLPFSRQLGLVIALILLALDGAAGVYFILRVTGPLRRVEAAALAMSRGDLATPIEGGYQILELARVFAALETMRSEISELLEREREGEIKRRELIANLSHDLRTPLAAIRGYVDGLREGIADTPEKVARYLSVLSQKIHDLDRMISQIFLLSTLDARESPPDFRVIDLRAFLCDCVEELRLGLPADVRIDAACIDGPSCPVAADPLQLRRVLENLVDNAIRHGDRRPLTVRIGLERTDDRAEVTIEDDGKGIAPEDVERVFERFFRADPARSGPGLGLGLAISKRIVEAHGGTISAARSSAGGALLRIRLPVAEQAK